MLVGHYAPAFAIDATMRARGAKSPPLWSLFLAVQAVDILFFALVPLGVERMAIHPDASGPLALDLIFMPYSHSLLVAVAYGGLAALVGWLAKRPALGVAIGLAIASHWFVDLLVHTPDLHVGLAAEPRVGLGLWRMPIVAVIVELSMLTIAAAFFARGAPRAVVRRTAIVVGVLCIAQVIFALAPATPLPLWALSLATEALYLVFAGLALFVDRAARTEHA